MWCCDFSLSIILSRQKVYPQILCRWITQRKKIMNIQCHALCTQWMERSFYTLIDFISILVIIEFPIVSSLTWAYLLLSRLAFVFSFETSGWSTQFWNKILIIQWHQFQSEARIRSKQAEAEMGNTRLSVEWVEWVYRKVLSHIRI